jgi:uncharacterized repeat protein (TIGR03833 family)
VQELGNGDQSFKLNKSIQSIPLKGIQHVSGDKITDMNGSHRAKIWPGLHVRIVLKNDQRSGKLTEGIVKDILTKAPTHPHGIKVRLEGGEVGRVKEILE